MSKQKKKSFSNLIKEIDNLLIKDPEKAEIFLENLLKNRKDFSIHERLQIKNKLGYSYTIQTKLKKSEQIYKKIYEYAKENNLQEEIADALTGFGNISIDQGDIKKAIKDCLVALNIYKKLNLKEKELNVSNLLGIMYYYSGDLEEGISWFEKILEKPVDLKPINYLKAVGNSALVYRSIGKINESTKMFEETIKISKKLGFDRGLCISYNNLADSLRSLGKYAESKKNYEEGLKIAEKLGNKQNIGLLSSGLGNYYVEIGKLDLAYKYFKISLKTYDEIDDNLGKILTLLGMSHYLLVKGKLIQAKNNLIESLELSEKSGIKEQYIEILTLLSQIYDSLGDIDKSYEYLKKADQNARERNSDFARILVLVQRGRILLNNGNFHEAEMILKESLWIAKKIHKLDIVFTSELLIARNYLIRFINKNDNKYLKKSIKHVTNVVNFTKKKNLIPKLLDALIVSGNLYVLENKVELAKKTLQEVISISIERSMNVHKRKATEIYSIIKTVKNFNKEKRSIKNLIKTIVMDELKNVTSSYDEAIKSKEDFDKIFIVTYKVDENTGTELHVVENQDINEKDWYKIIISMGALYSISLGQGQKYHKGLFGPLPFSKNNLNSIIYSRIIKDSSQISNRSGGETYFLYCFVFPKSLSSIFYNRKKLIDIFEDFNKNIQNIEEIDEIFLKNLREKILSEFLANWKKF